MTLAVMVMASTLLAGYEMAALPNRNWTYMVLYSVILAMALYVIVDLEYPRLGLIRVDAADSLLENLRHTM